MRHAAHKAAKVSNERFSVAKALFTRAAVPTPPRPFVWSSWQMVGVPL